MTSKDVNRLIRERVWKSLAPDGFDRRTARTAWRQRGEHVEVVNFQSFNSYLAERLGCTTFSFALNVGIWLLYAPASDVKVKGGRVLPTEYECPIRMQLNKRIEQPAFPRSDIWFVPQDGAYLSEIVEDAAAVLRDEGLPWFDSLSSPEAVVKLLDEAQMDMNGVHGFGNEGSPLRTHLQACVRMHLGTFAGDELQYWNARDTYRQAMDAWVKRPRGEMPEPPKLPGVAVYFGWVSGRCGAPMFAYNA